MTRFKDCLGREWSLRITVGALGQVRREAGVDLGQAMRSDQALADLLFGDPATLVSVLWVLVSDQALGLEVSPDSFAHGFDGPALERATEALLAAVADFFPRSKVGQALRTSLGRTLERMDQAVIERLAQASSSSAGSSPGSLDSILGD